MGIFNFNLITDPPGDEYVDEESQLNHNWDQIESGLGWLQYYNAQPPSLDVGIEALTGGNRHAVWNGSALRTPYSIPSGWTAWTTLTPVSPYVVRGAAYPFKWRRNSELRKVQVTGGIINTASAVAWPHTSWATFLTTGIASTYQPVGGLHLQHTATSGINSTVVGEDVAASRVRARTVGATVWLEAHYMGADGGGNFLMLDRLEWYY